MGMYAVTVDGSYGEGGGQILRYSALYSLISGREAYVVKIRANRPNPGLRPQHYTLLRIMRDAFGGYVEGLKVGSTNVRMKFRSPRPVNGRFDIGTAGSISLLLQSLIPPLLNVDSPSEIEVVGGTDVKWSPPISYMELVYSRLVEAFGGRVEIKVLRRGFYPRGGGRVKVYVEPANWRGLNRLYRADIKHVLVKNVVCRLPRHVLDRQRNTVIEHLRNRFGDKIRVEVIDEHCSDSLDPGTSVVVAGYDDLLAGGGDSLGERGKPAEKVAEDAVYRFLSWFDVGAALDKHLADMVIPLAILSGRDVEVGIEEYTKHVDSALYVSRLFFEDVKTSIDKYDRFYRLSFSR